MVPKGGGGEMGMTHLKILLLLKVEFFMSADGQKY
jgi:hypothetical protein